MKQYGIRVTMPAGDTMSMPHLLGDSWEGFRWFENEHERDQAYAHMLQQPGYYRRGDNPTQLLEKVSR